ncbi:hypothetical protein ACE4Z5_26895, partial [Salmonella enterica]|uniref:hypothetical protein n=1 Tax=Salmonella enterica TaxID=28901 RepID=UPI003D295A1A
ATGATARASVSLATTATGALVLNSPQDGGGGYQVSAGAARGQLGEIVNQPCKRCAASRVRPARQAARRSEANIVWHQSYSAI